MLRAIEHLGPVGVGITGPQFFRAHDDQIYVVKLENNRLGHKVLVSEMMAAQFGQYLDLCFPPSNLIEIPEHMSPYSGLHFASLYLDQCVYLTSGNMLGAVNLPEMAGILLFDHLFHNADRTNNRKNLLLRQEAEGPKIYAIDNSHLFRSGRWTLASLEQLSFSLKVYIRNTFGLLLRDCLRPSDFLPYLERVSKLTPCQIEGMIEQIPRLWLPCNFERQALNQFIQIRASQAELVWDSLCKYIPYQRGGRRRLRSRVIGWTKKLDD